MSDKPISSVEEFTSQIKSDYENWNTKTYPWFRGEPSDADKPLLPRLYREKNPDGNFKFNENQFVQFFRMKAPALIHPSILPARGDNDQWLFLMQHFRLPTRLLDWTEGALIALFFALQEDNPIVWMLHPCKLNELATDSSNWPDNVFPITWGNTQSPAFQNIQAAWRPHDPNFARELPIAIHPTNIHLRLSVQRSCFTVHGTLTEGIDKCIIKKLGTSRIDSALRRYAINNEQKDKMLKELRILGISYTTVFPDMQGLSQELETSFYNVSSIPDSDKGEP